MHLSRGVAAIMNIIRRFLAKYGPDGCWFGQQWLARRLKRTTRTIQRWIAMLRKAGLIAVKRRYKRTNVYSLVQPKMSSKNVASELPTEVCITASQYHRPGDDAVMETAGIKQLSDGDRRFLRDLRRSGTEESAILGGIAMGRIRKMACATASEPIRSLRYFGATIREAVALPLAYLSHCRSKLQRLT